MKTPPTREQAQGKLEGWAKDFEAVSKRSEEGFAAMRRWGNSPTIDDLQYKAAADAKAEAYRHAIRILNGEE